MVNGEGEKSPEAVSVEDSAVTDTQVIADDTTEEQVSIEGNIDVPTAEDNVTEEKLPEGFDGAEQEETINEAVPIDDKVDKSSEETVAETSEPV